MPAISDPRIRTLGLQTGLAIERGRATVREHGDAISVHTPSNPGYYFGNLLIFDRPPGVGDELRWPMRFAQLFAGDPRVRHAAFAWSGDDASYADAFIERGYVVEERAVLTAAQTREYSVPEDLQVRPLDSDSDWDAQLALGLAAREDAHEPEMYARFKQAQVAYHRRFSESSGVWLGAFDGNRLAGSCGIYSVDDGIARYQDVGVLPQYRNRGIARGLICAAAKLARERFGATQLVIVAEASDFPRRIYERCGFTLYQRECVLWIAAR
ncbi:MAG TPA: GNAT family N-acetyltransferase [Candidatus Baltobacteraceae bacterium]|nr:GNAT family N-acetyltransferase [Candidatus Baltobacteraceae bacterium]